MARPGSLLSNAAHSQAQRFIEESKKRNALLTELQSERKSAVSGGFGLFKKNFGLWGKDEE